MRECVDWYKLFPNTNESICLSVHNVPMGCRECLLLFILYVIFRGWRFVPPFHSDFLNFLPSGPQKKKKSKRMFNIEREKTWRVEACPSKKLLRVTPCKDLCKICIYLLWNSRILTCVCAPETTWSHLRNRIQEPARAWSPSSESKSSWAVTAQDRQYLKIKMGIWCISPLFSFCIHVKGRNGWYYS